jgi:hypothetical protein
MLIETPEGEKCAFTIIALEWLALLPHIREALGSNLSSETGYHGRYFFDIPLFLQAKPGGTQYHSWLRHCATSRKVAGSIPDEVIGFFN